MVKAVIFFQEEPFKVDAGSLKRIPGGKASPLEAVAQQRMQR